MGVLKILDHNLQSLVDVQFTLRHGGYQYGIKFDLNQRHYLFAFSEWCMRITTGEEKIQQCGHVHLQQITVGKRSK